MNREPLFRLCPFSLTMESTQLIACFLRSLQMQRLEETGRMLVPPASKELPTKAAAIW